MEDEMHGIEEKIRFLDFSIRSSRGAIIVSQLMLPVWHLLLVTAYALPVGYKVYLAAQNIFTIWLGLIWVKRWRSFADLKGWYRISHYSAFILAPYLVVNWVSSNLFTNFYDWEMINPFVFFVILYVVLQTNGIRNIREAQKEIAKLKAWATDSSVEGGGK